MTQTWGFSKNTTKLRVRSRGEIVREIANLAARWRNLPACLNVT